MTNKEYWHGIIPPLITPLTPEKTLDHEGLERTLEHIINGGCTGVFIAGSTGEPTDLRKEVLLDLIRSSIKIVNNRIPICCGVIEPGTERTIEQIKKVQNLGIDFVCCTPNFYLSNENGDEIIRHYERIDEQTSVKMMVYNNLGTTGVDIQAATFFRISEIDNVIAYKDTRSDWENHLKAIDFVKDKDISLISGGEYLLGAGFLLGSNGNIAASSNLFPKLFVELYQAGAIDKDIDKTLALSAKIATLNEITRTGQSWLHGIKYAASKLGLCQDIVSGNFSPLNASSKAQIDRIIEKFSEYR